MVKRKEILMCFIFCSLALLICSNSNLAYAGNIIGTNSSIIFEENASTFSARAILKIADEKIEEGRTIEDVVLLQGQSFEIEKDDVEYCVISKDEKLTIKNDSSVIGNEVGQYKLTVFYKDIGFIDYNIQIRSPEIVENNQIILYGDTTYCLNLQNSDLATYKSSDESIITVSENGVIQAKRKGKAVITVTINECQTVEFYVNAVTTFPDYTEEELNLIYAIVQQECATSYDGALAVISCAYNRSLSDKHIWKGADPLSQLTATGQFCYSLDNHWKRYLNGNVYDYVKQAVYNCLYLGKTNHNFLSYRGFEIEGAVEFDGNFYFDSITK